MSDTHAPAPPPATTGHPAPLESLHGARAQRRQRVRGVHGPRAVDQGQREQRAPGAPQEAGVDRGLQQLGALAHPAEAEQHVVEVEIGTAGHGRKPARTRGAAGVSSCAAWACRDTLKEAVARGAIRKTSGGRYDAA
jgi:hypothetical protein